jgi:hypothetical protein
MKTNKFRWFQLQGLVVIASMLLAFASPVSANAKATSQSVKPSVQGKVISATRQATLPSLSKAPIKSLSQLKVPDGMVGGELPVKKPLSIPSHAPWVKAGTTTSNVKAAATTCEGCQIDLQMPGSYSWDGINQGVNRAYFQYGFVPPDPNGDTSGDVSTSGYYIQTVNNVFEIWDYSQNNVFGPWPKSLLIAPTNTLFSSLGGACATTNDGDPIVRYDSNADRWLISQFALPLYDFNPNPYASPFYECIAISASGDPMGAWYTYEFPFATMPDYPKIGIWPDGYYMTTNQFDGNTGNWEGEGVTVFDRTTMLAGGSATMQHFDLGYGCSFDGTDTSPLCYLGSMLPGDADGTFPTLGTPNRVMQFDDDAWSNPNWVVPDQLEVWSVSVDWGTPANSTVSSDVNLPVNAFDSNLCNYSRECIPQPGTAAKLDAISDRLMNRLQFRQFGDHQSMVVNQTVDVNGADRAGIRWYELRNTGSGWSVYQQGTYSPDTTNRWMGSIAMDAVGNIALGYSASNATNVYPSVRYAGRLVTDALNALPRAEQTIRAGGGSQTADADYGAAYARWGDYSSMSVAPDGCDFVYTNEYYRVTSSMEWSTKIGNFKFPSCVSNDVTVPDTFIDSTPADPSNVSSASFTFHGTDAGPGAISFECSLDGGVYTTCSSPVNYPNLKGGTHTFAVHAVDGSSNIDPTPASFTWLVRERTVNGGFNNYAGASKVPSSWTASQFASGDGKDITTKYEGAASVKLNGAGTVKTLTQRLSLSGAAGNPMTFSFWVKGTAVPSGGLCQGQIMFYNSGVLKQTKTIACPTGSFGFQKKTATFTASAAFNKVVIVFTYFKPGGTVWFDAASLLK